MHRTSRVLSILLASIATLLGAACTTEPEEDISETSTAIRNGTLTDDRPEVGMLALPGGTCTATLVKPRIVLTASHCVLPAAGGGADSRGSIQGSFKYRVDGVESEVALERYARKRDSFRTALDSRDDVALVRLASEPAGVTPAVLASTAPGGGDTMTAFGYGTNDCGTANFWRVGTVSTAGVKRKRDYVWGGPVYVICPGDSGGPHFGSDGKIQAVTSGSRLFGNVSAVVSANREWLDSAIEELER